MDTPQDFDSVTRKALFGPDAEIPGKGSSAAEGSRRHVRTKITINLDEDVVEYFKEQSAREGLGYQLLINRALRGVIEGSSTERVAKTVGAILLSDKSFLKRIATELDLEFNR